MTTAVRKYVRNCRQCAFGKEFTGKRAGLLHPIEKVAISFDTLHLDRLGPLDTSPQGYKYILTMVDAFTKFVILTPTKSTDCDSVVKALNTVIDLFGVPGRIIADRDTLTNANKSLKTKSEIHTIATILYQ